MHELSLAQSLLDIVLEEAGKHQVERVTRVVIKVGVFTQVVPHSLVFCFDLIKKDTLAAEAELVVEQVPLAGRCWACGAELNIDEPAFTCPRCGSSEVQVTQGRDMWVDYIEADDPDGG